MKAATGAILPIVLESGLLYSDNGIKQLLGRFKISDCVDDTVKSTVLAGPRSTIHYA